MIRFLPSLAGATCALACVSVATAQQFLGHWDDQSGVTPPGGTQSIDIFVDASAPLGGIGTATLPFRTITEGLALPQLLTGYPGILGSVVTDIRFTINVAPGLYDANEIFPLDLPANGVSLETWNDGTFLPDDRAIITSAGGPAVRVAWIGEESMPASVIQGLDITGGPAILVSPATFGTDPGTEVLSVEIRDNRIAGSRGIELETPPGFSTQYVLENNDIGREAFEILSGVGGVGVSEVCFKEAAASTLYRSNRIQLYERLLSIDNQSGLGKAGALTCVPRLFSNILQFGETLAAISNCDTFLINNTLAFAVNLGGNPAPVGLSVTNGSLELHNNILWSPDVTGGGALQAAMPIDLILTNVVLPNPPLANIIFDQVGIPTAANSPNFVDGNVVPTPLVIPMDLHLTPASVAAIGQGSLASAIDLTETVRSWMYPSVPMGIETVRTDVSLDNDLDSRVHNSGVAGDAGLPPMVDIGGDEFRQLLPFVGARPIRDGRIEFTDRMGACPPTQNALGNVVPELNPVNPNQPYLVTLFLDGQPNGAFVVFITIGFFEEIFSPAIAGLTPNDALYQNFYLPILGLGSLAFDLNPGLSVSIAGGLFDANGEAIVNHRLTFGQPIFDPMGNSVIDEAECYYQMATFDPAPPAGRWGVSNRVKFELDQRP